MLWVAEGQRNAGSFVQETGRLVTEAKRPPQSKATDWWPRAWSWGADASSRCEQFSSAVKAGLAQPSRLRGLTGFSRVKEYGQSAYVGWLEAEEQSEDVQVERLWSMEHRRLSRIVPEEKILVWMPVPCSPGKEHCWD
eukprot:scaffold68194_cov16-Tisochrysis_lutea.AAC.2